MSHSLIQLPSAAERRAPPLPVIVSEDLHGVILSATEVENRFRLMIEGVIDYAILNLDTRGTVVSWNEGVRRIKGYASEEILGRNFACFYTAEDVAAGRPQQILQQAQQEGHFQEEGWRVRKDGSRFWANVLITAIKDRDGQSMGYIKITRDLSERRAIEQRLAQVDRLRETMMNAAPYAIIATDPQGLITSINPAAERMLWYSDDELVGREFLQKLHDPEEMQLRAAELSAKYRETIGAGFEVFVHESRSGLVEEREWIYIRKDGSRFPVHLAVTVLRNDSNEVSGFLCIAYDITERKRREAYTLHIAYHDQLTGLPSRALLQDRLGLALQRARRDQKQVGVLMIDLDHFKRVNDSLGHHIGDQLLKTIAQRIVAAVRGADTVARMGGDEFAVILPDLSMAGDAERIAAKIIDSITLPISIAKSELTVTPSIGISCYPDDGNDHDALLKNADAAMYSAKAAGRHGYRRFSLEMHELAIHKLNLEAALRIAIKDHSLEVHYQPQASLKSGHIVAMEALLRWQHPQYGNVSPTAFIPVAEESGLIVPIGEWVLRTACRDAGLLEQRCGTPVIIAVNLSARQFRHGSLQLSVQAALGSTGLDPALLELEITESVLMDHQEESGARLRALRAMGISVVMDDFGTGFSSLSYLTQFPINGLKIDQSFIKKMMSSKSDLAIVQAIAAMAHSLNLKVIAEGVETEQQIAFLQQRIFDSSLFAASDHESIRDEFNMQGFVLCRPISMTQLCANFAQLQRNGEQLVYRSMH